MQENYRYWIVAFHGKKQGVMWHWLKDTCSKNIELERCFSFDLFFGFKIQLFRWEETGPTVLSAGDCAAASKYILDAEVQEVCTKYRFSKYIH